MEQSIHEEQAALLLPVAWADTLGSRLRVPFADPISRVLQIGFAFEGLQPRVSINQ